ncbi:MAG: hypothetical protein KKA65_04380 [Nanoarchaeota archaeon]|nr:hypothetical protein [Nanoarchaeota archaeon]MBU4456712.1 hypothetical protein [Nanoarchaeota archaeon]
MNKNLNIAKKIILNKQLNWKEGELFLWNLSGFLIPTYTFIDLIYNLYKDYKKAEDLLFKIGKKQTILAIGYMKSKFGFKKDLDIVKSVLEQSSLLGIGIFEIIKFNLKSGEVLIKNTNNPIAKYYKIIHGKQKKPIDFYIAGTMAGIIEGLTKKKTTCTETKCIVKGDKYCLFKIKVLGPVNLEDKHELKKEKKICSSPT